MPRSLSLLLMITAWLIGLSLPAVVRADRPHVLFIMTDDQGPWALGRWEGHTHAITPNLDRLFTQSAVLKNCFTPTPVCSPSRASLATSKYGSELGIHDWLNPNVEPKHGLDPSTVTWYELLQRAGYHTGLIGKWHLGLTDAHHPTATGFNYFMGHRGGGWSPKDPTLEKDGKQTKLSGLTTDILTDHAIEFIRNRPQDKPFLLSLHYRAPHAAWLPVAPEDWAPFEKLDPVPPHPDYPGLDTERVKRVTREYLASVHGVDRNVGRLMKFLEDQKLAENTIVIFTSDHGYNMGHNGIWHKGNGHWILKKDALPEGTKNVPAVQRPNMFDMSIRVPAAIRWPGVTRAGQVVDQTITFLDVFPSVCAMAGVEVPRELGVRGRDFTPLLKGKSIPWDNDLYGEYSTKHQTRTHMRMYRTPKWKLVRDLLNPGRDELYDLANDSDERKNLISSDDAKVKQVIADLSQRIEEQMKRLKDPVLTAQSDSH
ncbi:MAG: sulfatase-like hydrolase/transferase [Phycisphaeraceae bacterium]